MANALVSFGSYFDYFDGTRLASFLVLLIGFIGAVIVAVMLNMTVFNAKGKGTNITKFNKLANGQSFISLSLVKITYYAATIFLVFKGISAIILSGYSGIVDLLVYLVLGNLILRIAYETVLAVRKNAGLDTDNNTALEPKTDKPLFPQAPQQYQQPAPGQQMYQQPMGQPMYQQPAPAPVQQPVQTQQPAPVPVYQSTPVPQPAPAPAPVPVQQAAPAPVQQAAPAPIPQPVPAPAAEPAQVQLGKPAELTAPTCPHCGKGIKAGARFCPFCGQPTDNQ